MARSKEFNEERALAAAVDVFWRQGYENTSLEALMREMGIARQSLYDTFGDKRALYLKAMVFYRERTNSSLRFFTIISRKSRASWKVSPVVNFPEASIASPPSLSRHAPVPSKCSNAKPIGSIRSWHDAQFGLARCCSIFCRMVPESGAFLSSSVFTTSGGGGGGGVPRMFSRIHLPRFTGEVRVGFDVMVRIPACVSSPPRGTPRRLTF